ncbi:MAG: cysteine desulfurase NifS [Raoultibacter sp.]
MKSIYLDNAATTKLRPEVVEMMLPFYTEDYGNPSALYPLGQRAADAVENARGLIADFLGASPKEIYFTSGGSEADNWALFGVARANAKRGRHIITSAIEHHAVLHACQALEAEGFELTYLPVNSDGLVSAADFEAAIRPDTILASLMYANNEIGSIQPIAELGRIARAHKVIFHTDAVQAFGHESIDVEAQNIDLLSASAHKLYGPKGVGLLYVRKGIKIDNLIFGGAQERGRRATTENVAGIVGFGRAVELAAAEQDTEQARQRALRDQAITRIAAEIPYCQLNGSAAQRLANNINFSFRFIEGEGMLLQLAAKGICASSGSACTSGSLDPSHVLLAIGLPHEIAHGSLRLTMGHETSADDLDFAIDCLKTSLANLRAMSPLYEDFVRAQNQAGSLPQH